MGKGFTAGADLGSNGGALGPLLSSYAAANAVNTTGIGATSTAALVNVSTGDRQLVRSHVVSFNAVGTPGTPSISSPLRLGTVTTFVADALVWTAEVHIEQWKRCGDANGDRRKQIKRLSDAISDYSRKYSFAYPLSRRIRAELRWLEGRVARAVANCEASLTAAHAREMPYDVARCHHALGEHLPVGDPRRREHEFPGLRDGRIAHG